MTTRFLTALTVLLITIGALSSVHAATAAPPPGWSATPDRIWDVTTPDPNVRHTGPVRALVRDLQEFDGRMYAAGKFLEVKAPDGSTRSQPYLAAFDLETGVWDSAFRPVLDGAIYSLAVTSDGRLLAGGEVTGGVVALNPSTGARIGTFDPQIRNSWNPAAVFDVEVSGEEVFIGGTFTRAQGQTLSNLAKLDARTGAIDPNWIPTAQFDDVTPRLGGRLVFGIAVDEARDRVYVAGKFGGINNNLDAAYFATIDTDDGSLRADVPQGLPDRVLSHRDSFSMWMHDVQFRDDVVYLGGQAHQTIIMDAATLTAEKVYFQNRGVGDVWTGGDTQVLHLGANTVWSGCHCWGSVGEYPLGSYAADPSQSTTAAEYSRWVADFRDLGQFGQQKVNGQYGIDIATRELVPVTFSPRGIAGAYAISEDSNGRVWFGGQYDRDPVTGRSIEGIARFSPLGGPPSAPTGLRTTLQTRERVVLNWAARADASSYDILRDGVVVTSQQGRWYTDLGLSAGTTYDYRVRAVLADGTTTASSPVLSVTTISAQVSAPTGLRSTLQTRERAVLNWQAVPNASRYEILRDGGVVGSSTGRWYTDLGLAAGTTYTYRVRAVLADGTTTPSSAPIAASTRP